MNRRQFIKTMLITAIGSFTGLSYFFGSKKSKEEIIAEALRTEEGGIAFKKIFCKPPTDAEARILAQNILAKIKKELDDLRVGEKFLSDEDGWQVAMNPVIKLSEVKSRRFYIKEKQNVRQAKSTLE